MEEELELDIPRVFSNSTSCTTANTTATVLMHLK